MLQELLVSAGHRLPLWPFAVWIYRPVRSALGTASNINSLFQVMEDPLQSQRLKYAFESEKGLLGASQTQKKLLLFYCKYISEIGLFFFS